MLNNLENKVENMHNIMKSLTSGELATKKDINFAFNELANSLKSFTDVTNEEFAHKFIESFKYLLDEKNQDLKNSLYDLQNMLSKVSNKDLQNDVMKLSDVLNNLFSKFNEQEHIFLNLSKSLESVLSAGSKENIEDLKNDFSAFSNSTNNILRSIDSNFKYFLKEAESLSNKDDLKDVNDSVKSVVQSLKACLSAVEVIDTKYQDMKSVVDLVTNNESSLARLLDEIKLTSVNFESVLPKLKKIMTTDDVVDISDKINFITSFLGNLRELIEVSNNNNIQHLNEYAVSIESKILALQKGASSDNFENAFKNVNERLSEILDFAKDDIIRNVTGRISSLNDTNREKIENEFFSLKENFKNLSSSLIGLDNTISQNILVETNKVKESVSLVDVKVEDLSSKFRNFLDDTLQKRLLELEENTDRLNRDNYVQINSILTENINNIKDVLNQTAMKNVGEVEANVDAIKKEVKTILLSLLAFKEDFEKSNIKVMLQDVVENAILKIDESPTGSELKNLGEEVSRVSQKLNGIFGAIEDNFDKLETSSSVEILQNINSIVPALSESLNNVQEKIVQDNQTLYNELKKFTESVADTLKVNVDAFSSAVKTDNKEVTRVATQELRQDLQTLSNTFTESLDGINSLVLREFVEVKEKFQSLPNLIESTKKDINFNIDSVKSSFETNSSDIKESLSKAISQAVIQFTDHINNVTNDVLNKITSLDELSNASFSDIEKKVSELIKSVFDNHTATVQKELNDFDVKIDKLSSSQNDLSNDLKAEISSLANLHSDESVAFRGLIQKVESKLSEPIDFSSMLTEQMNYLRKAILDEVKNELFKQAQSTNAGFVRISNLNNINEQCFSDLNQKIDTMSKSVMQSFQGEFQKQYQVVLSFFNKIVENIETDDNFRNELKNTLFESTDKLIQEFKSELSSKIQGVIDEFSAQISRVRPDDAINNLSEKIVLLESSLMNNLKDIILDKIEKVYEKVDFSTSENSKVNLIGDIVDSAKGDIVSKFNSISSDILDKIENSSFDTKENIVKILNEISEKVSDISNNNVLSKLDDVKEDIYSSIYNLNHVIDNKISSLSNDNVISKLDDVKDNISLSINVLKDNIQNISEKADGISSFKDEFGDFSSNIKNKIDSFIDKIAMNLDNELKKQSSFVDTVFQRIDILKDELNTKDDFDEVKKLINNLKSEQDNIFSKYNFSDLKQDISDVKEMVTANDVSDIQKSIAILKTVSQNNFKMNKNLDQQLNYVNNWLRGAAEALEILAHKVDKIEKTSFDISNLNTDRFDTIALNLLKRFKMQDVNVQKMSDKIDKISISSKGIGDMSAFIKVVHDNVSETKGLASRIDVLENQLSNMQKSLDRIISYIEE